MSVGFVLIYRPHPVDMKKQFWWGGVQGSTYQINIINAGIIFPLPLSCSHCSLSSYNHQNVFRTEFNLSCCSFATILENFKSKLFSKPAVLQILFRLISVISAALAKVWIGQDKLRICSSHGDRESRITDILM